MDAFVVILQHIVKINGSKNIFLFLVGLELDSSLLRGRGRAAVSTAAGAFVIPFALGVALAAWLSGRYAPPGIPFSSFALFLGVATSATAFPVLARILKESGLLQTPIGVTALSAAAFNDVAAWIGLTAVVAVATARAEALPFWMLCAGMAAYVVVMVCIVRPLLARMFSPDGDRYSHDRMAVALIVLLSSAMATAWLGLHVAFGAFAAGLVMPRGATAESLRARLEDVTLVLLLPLFFVITGLRSDITVLYEPGMALTCVVVIVAATASKLGGTWLGATVGGVRGGDARALGVLMNTRGLMELVVLNIGLEVGVIPRPLFTIFVLMALVTTCMTSPLLRVLRRT